MVDVVITGASRGIGRALALKLAAPDRKLVLVARDEARLGEIAAEIERRGGKAAVVTGDLGSIAAARDVGDRLARQISEGAILIHNAGLWPNRRVVGGDGFEASYVVNFLGPLALQAPLIERSLLSRIMLVSAGLLVKGRFDRDRTPRGDDFSAFRTYATTKLCLASAMRDVAARHPEIDVVVLHPGVVRTDLGARPGLLGAILSLVKRTWESPEACADRLARILERPRWSSANAAAWLVEENDQPWPAVLEDDVTRRLVREAAASALEPVEKAP
ncbi:MAG: SDR family NAD(P)-dependent oxidoreductase [Polyangiaceae bacterium]|nr:SDR family NAD(P)-dependent oxidoreductase [Polyangiaceae bacterium]